MGNRNKAANKFKADVLRRLKEAGKTSIKTRFYKKSPYQKNRYKPEFVGSEIWIYNLDTSFGKGFLITETSWREATEAQQKEMIKSI